MQTHWRARSLLALWPLQSTPPLAPLLMVARLSLKVEMGQQLAGKRRVLGMEGASAHGVLQARRMMLGFAIHSVTTGIMVSALCAGSTALLTQQT